LEKDDKVLRRGVPRDASAGLAGIFLALSLLACTTGASTSAPSLSGGAATIAPPALPTTVSSPNHLYELRVPQGWTARMAAARDPDEISGTEGAITVRLSAVPEAIAQSDWIDSYLDIHAADFPAGCLSGGGAPQELLAIGADDGRLLKLACLPGWMVIVAHDDRLYDLRFKVSGDASPAAKALFVAIVQGLKFLPGSIPSPAPST